MCRAISADLAGEAVPLREIMQARTKRRYELFTTLKNRQKAVDTLLSLKRGLYREETHEAAPFQKGLHPKTQTLPERVVTRVLSRRWNTSGSLSSAMPAVSTDRSPLLWTAGGGQDALCDPLQPEEIIGKIDPWTAEFPSNRLLDTVLYTPSVINSPRGSIMTSDVITRCSPALLNGRSAGRLRRPSAVLRARDESHRKANLDKPLQKRIELSSLKPTYLEVFADFAARERAMADPTTLLLIDEADRLRMTKLRADWRHLP